VTRRVSLLIIGAFLLVGLAACDQHAKGDVCAQAGDVYSEHPGQLLTCTNTRNGLRWE
jgi:hypothetical protein